MTQDLWQINDVRLGPDHRPRLSVDALTISDGVTAVLGESGAGKSSLLNLLVGFERLDAGNVRCLFRQQTNHSLAWVPADGGLWPPLTVREHLAGVIRETRQRPLQSSVESSTHNQSARFNGNELESWLQRFDLLPVAEQRPATLSMGERSRLSVARALASGAQVLVMDEPLAHVDSARQDKYWNVIRDILAENRAALVFATHEVEPVLREARTVICLSGGRVAWQGGVSELYREPPNAEVAGFLGPTNWFIPAEAQQWLGRTTTSPICVRPEQLEVLPHEGGPFRVEEAQFAGSIASAVVRDVSNNQRRRLLHRPRENSLSPGCSVMLRVFLSAWLLAMSCTSSGCGTSADGPTLTTATSHQYSLPAEGSMLPAPRGMTFGPNEDLYILDNAGRMLVYDKGSKLLRSWWMPEYSVGRPEGSCILRDGRIAVADTHYHRVIFFDQQGKFLSSIGKEGTGPSEFIYTVSITQDAQENLYVAEYGTHDRIQKFTVDGKFILEFGKPGTAPGEFQRPSGVVWKDGIIYVADSINNRIQAFQEDGKFLRIVADGQTAELYYPYDLSFGPDGSVFIIEYGGSRVTQISLDGKVLSRYGSPGRGPGQLFTPWGIAVSKSGKVAIADTGNRRVVELQL